MNAGNVYVDVYWCNVSVHDGIWFRRKKKYFGVFLRLLSRFVLRKFHFGDNLPFLCQLLQWTLSVIYLFIYFYFFDVLTLFLSSVLNSMACFPLVHDHGNQCCTLFTRHK